MTIYEQHLLKPDEALLDSASTHTILTNPNFSISEEIRNLGSIITMPGSRNIRFQEGRATVILPRGFLLNCERIIYALDAPRNLISYRNLRARNIYVSTAVKNNEEVLELRQRLMIIAIAKAEDDGLYKIVINFLDNESLISLIYEEEVCMAAWTEHPEALRHNLAQGVSVDTKAKPYFYVYHQHSKTWHTTLSSPPPLPTHITPLLKK